jgi:pyruvate dehydrogenase E2 component (dihydrolipoamide acetyltransferase)
MAKAVVMPKAGITVESCIIGEWKKKPGDHVAVGDILFDYETDKASFECESTEEGILLERFYGNGDEVKVLVNVCAVGAPGEDVSALRPAGVKAASPAPAQAGAEAPTKVAPAAPSVPAAAAEQTEGMFRISPRARGLAERSGVDASTATGSGPLGRIIEADIRRLMKDG